MSVTAYTVFACDDCIIAAANGEFPDRDVEYAELVRLRDNGSAPWLYGRDLVREPDALALLSDNEQLVDDCTDEDEASFSWHPCDTCGTKLGGDRHHATIIRTTSEEYVDAV